METSTHRRGYSRNAECYWSYYLARSFPGMDLLWPFIALLQYLRTAMFSSDIDSRVAQNNNVVILVVVAFICFNEVV